MKDPKVLYPWIRRYKEVQSLVPWCICLYRLIQGYRAFGYFIVLPCTVMYRVTGNQGIGVLEIRRNDGMYQYVLVHTSTYCFILTGECVYWYIQVYTVTYKYIPVHTSTYQYIPACTRSYLYILVHTSTYQYIPVHTYPNQGSKKMQTGFEPVIFCILFACIPTALQGYRHQIPDV